MLSEVAPFVVTASEDVLVVKAHPSVRRPLFVNVSSQVRTVHFFTLLASDCLAVMLFERIFQDCYLVYFRFTATKKFLENVLRPTVKIDGSRFATQTSDVLGLNLVTDV